MVHRLNTPHDPAISVRCIIGLIALFGFFAPACMSPGPPIPAPQGQSESGNAEWDDLDAAISWTATKHELGIENQQDPSPEIRVYQLNTIRGEPVYVQFQRGEAGSAYESAPVEITVQYGFFGDDDKERAIARTLRSRLVALGHID